MKMKYDTSTIEGKIQVMERYKKDPKRLHIYTIAGWRPYNNDCEDPPGWNWIEFHYNYPAEPTLKPWTFETCPKGHMLIAHKENKTVMRSVILWEADGILSVTPDFNRAHFRWEFLHRTHDHSLDGGKTWQPCGNYEL